MKMLVKQISVFLENKSGRLAKVTSVIGESGVDIRAMSIADTTDFGILRLIVNQPEKIEAILKEKGFTVRETEVIAVGMEDKPGSLANILTILENSGMSIEYMYAFVGNNDMKAVVIIKVEDNKKAIQLLSDNGIQVLPAEKVYQI